MLDYDAHLHAFQDDRTERASLGRINQAKEHWRAYLQGRNGQADISKQLNCKTVLLAFALGIIFLLNACAFTSNVPVRIPDLAYQDTGENAYLWKSGKRWAGLFNLSDYATIKRIDDVNIPAESLPWRCGRDSTSMCLLEIPVGSHSVEILYEEQTLICGYVTCLLAEVSRQILTFNAEPNRTYAPFVTDQCDRNYFWIEDWGPYVAGSKAQHLGFVHKSDLTKPVVAGEIPNKDSCD